MNLPEHIVTSSSGEYSRKIWLLETPKGSTEKLGIFLDGEFYLNRMEAPSLLLQLQETDAIPSMLCVFVSHIDGDARHHDLTCNPRYSGFIALDVVGWLRKKYDDLSLHNHLIVGPSLGGLASTYLALSHPQIFSQCLSQSGSFWWKNEWLKNNLDALPESKGTFWLSVGDKEIESGVSHPPTGLRQDVTQVSACERMASALREKGHSVKYAPYQGGHDVNAWKKELPEALTSLLGKIN